MSSQLGFFKARVWQGMPLSVWLTLLARNRFAVSWSRVPQALRMTLFAGVNSLLHRTDQLLYGWRTPRVRLAPPVFIVGHWRTGTTLLHELLVLDEQFNYPTTYQCMAPHHFLLSTGVVTRLLGHMLPAKRPMDNMSVGFDRPQEDEFIFCNAGVGSPYLKWMFANRDTSACEPYLELEGLSERQLRRWDEALVWFLKRVSFRAPQRRVVLKSPTHTARVGHLQKLFPGATFIHIVRNPYVVFPSMVHTWKQLWTTMGFQVPTFEGLDEYVLSTFERMYSSFERARPSLDEKHLYEVRYEDLIADPLGELRKMYDRLGLGDFERARPRLEAYLAGQRDYKTNRYEIAEPLRQAIATRWRGYIERYGYG